MGRVTPDHNLPKSLAEGAAETRPNDYDAFADAYALENEHSPFNALYERPAMLELAGDVRGRAVLDAGCGSGALTAAFHERGAVVTGVDSSAAMLLIARRRLGSSCDLHVANLEQPLPFPDDNFDDVVASLVLHYIRDWGPTLNELRRVLRPGGRLLLSVDHPFVAYEAQRISGQIPTYFETFQWSFEWRLGDRTVPMTFWARPLHAMTDAFDRAGFHILTIREPQPLSSVRDAFPEAHETLSTRPGFLFFALGLP